MEPVTIPSDYLKALTDGMNSVIGSGRDAARELLTELIAEAGTDNPLELVEDVAETLEPLFQAVSEQTAALSAQSYDLLRTAVTGETFGATPYAARDERWTKRALYGIAGDHRDNIDAFIEGVLDRMDYEAKRSAGQTTFQNGKQDPKRPRYARVPTGPETCRFCVMLASRGFVYHSEQTAGALDHYHPNCDCRIIPGYPGMVVDGYDPDEYLKILSDMEAEGVYKITTDGESAPTESASIDRSAAVYAGLRSEYVDSIEELFDAAPEVTRTIYKRFEENFRLSPAKGKGAYFGPYEMAVTLDPDFVLGDEDRGPRIKGATWFHEFGHSIDYMSTGTDSLLDKLSRMAQDRAAGNGHRSMYASVAYKDGLFGKTLKKEVDAKVKAEWDKLKDEKKDVLNLLDSLDFDTMHMRGYITVRQREQFERTLETSRQYAEASGTDPKAEFMDTRFVKNFISGYAAKRRAYERISSEINNLPHSHNDTISDIFEGATRGKVKDYWSHGNAYWKDQDNVPIEAFAEFYSAEVMDPDAVGLIEEYFPESKKVFDELVGALAEGEDLWQT